MRLAQAFLLLAGFMMCCSILYKISILQHAVADHTTSTNLHSSADNTERRQLATSDHIVEERERTVLVLKEEGRRAVVGVHRRRNLQQVPGSTSWNWKDAMIKALKDNNGMGNIMINRVGQLWWDRKVPPGLNSTKEYDIRINDVAFHVCTFKGSAFFQTMGWYGWENWGFQGQFSRVDTFTVSFN